MEIAPVPHRTSRSEWRRLATGLLVLAPVVLLVLLPAVLGLDRYVITDSHAPGSAGRGSVVLAREVSPADLAVGDVVSVARHPDPEGQGGTDRRTREITSIDDGVMTLAGGLSVPLQDQTYARVWLSIPWIGYPFVVDGGWVLLSAAALGALTIAMLGGRRRPVRAMASPRLPRPELPVA